METTLFIRSLLRKRSFLAQQEGIKSLGHCSTKLWKVVEKVMGLFIIAVHRRNPGKHCVNLWLSPDAEFRAFVLND